MRHRAKLVGLRSGCKGAVHASVGAEEQCQDLDARVLATHPEFAIDTSVSDRLLMWPGPMVG